MEKLYNAPSRILMSLIHTGVMKRVRMSKEKSLYSQIVYPNDKDNKIGFVADHFGACLPHRLMVTDKKMKELKEVKVEFKVLKQWNENWATCKIIKMLGN